MYKKFNDKKKNKFSYKNFVKNKNDNVKKNTKNVQSKKNSKSEKTKRTSKNEGKLKIIPLGGLNEIGKNITVYEYKGSIIIVDCGMSFPDDELLGIDVVIPDFSYLEDKKDKIKGLFVTHGHEDHIGGIPYLLKILNIKLPIYATRLTAGLISEKLKEHDLLNRAVLNSVNTGQKIKIGPFNVDFIHVNHSIPDACGFAISTDAGVIIQTGDFKVDTTPIDDNVIDIASFADYGKKGVLALLSDSTNAERQGFTPSERIVGDSFSNLFQMGEGNRIIVATFSSNIHRIQQIIDEAVNRKRKVAICGRSMVNVVKVASELGYLKVPDRVLVDINSVKQYAPSDIVIITTGSQGEPMSALHKMAFGDHRLVKIQPNDMIIISAQAIPGNEKTVGNVVNELIKLGANVVYEKMYDVHVSGHACQEELKLMLSITKPKYFIPVHGERKHLVKHAFLATQVGINKKNIVIAENGTVIELKNSRLRAEEKVCAGKILVDGYGLGNAESNVLKDRKHLAEDGLVIITFTIDSFSKEVISGPEIFSRGFIYEKDSEELFAKLRSIATKTVMKYHSKGVFNSKIIKKEIKDNLYSYIHDKTNKNPMILPIIMEV